MKFSQGLTAFANICARTLLRFFVFDSQRTKIIIGINQPLPYLSIETPDIVRKFSNTIANSISDSQWSLHKPHLSNIAGHLPLTGKKYPTRDWLILIDPWGFDHQLLINLIWKKT